MLMLMVRRRRGVDCFERDFVPNYRVNCAKERQKYEY